MLFRFSSFVRPAERRIRSRVLKRLPVTSAPAAGYKRWPEFAETVGWLCGSDFPEVAGRRLALEGEMDSAARCSFRFERIASFQATQIVPQAYAAPEQNRCDRDVKTIDKTRL